MSLATLNAQQARRAGRALFGTRSRVGAWLQRAGDVRVPAKFGALRWLTLAAVVLFAIQVATGILLALYYYAEPAAAHASVRFLTAEVPTGFLVRGIHRWAADLLLLAIFAHLAVAYWRRAYAKPREAGWVVAVLLLVVVHAFRFTGSLLPWDADAVASASRGLDLLRSVPVVGSLPATWLRGGEEFGANTLSRFFTTHALILPWIAAGLLALHVRWLRRNGDGRKGGAR